MENKRVRNLENLISFRGVTTGDGAAGGSTIVCADLGAEPDFDGLTVVIASGDYKGQAALITGATTGGTITVVKSYDGKILDGTEFAVVSIVATDVATLETNLSTIETVVDGIAAAIEAIRNADSGDTVMDGSEQTLYEESDTVSFEYE